MPRQALKHCPQCHRSCCPCHRKFPAHSADCARNNPVRSRFPRCRTFGRHRRRRPACRLAGQSLAAGCPPLHRSCCRDHRRTYRLARSVEWQNNQVPSNRQRGRKPSKLPRIRRPACRLAGLVRLAHCPRCHRNYCRDHRRFQFRVRRQRRCIAAHHAPVDIPKLPVFHIPLYPQSRTRQALKCCPPLHRSCCRDHRRTYQLARSVEWQNNQVPSNRQRGRKPSKLPRIRRPACRLAGLVRLAHCPRCHRNYCRDHRRFQFRVRRQRRCIAAHHAPVDIPKLPVFHIPLYPQSRTRQALKCCPPLHRSCCRDHRRFLPSDFRPEHHTQVYQIKYCRP